MVNLRSLHYMLNNGCIKCFQSVTILTERLDLSKFAQSLLYLDFVIYERVVVKIIHGGITFGGGN